MIIREKGNRMSSIEGNHHTGIGSKRKVSFMMDDILNDRWNLVAGMDEVVDVIDKDDVEKEDKTEGSNTLSLYRFQNAVILVIDRWLTGEV